MIILRLFGMLILLLALVAPWAVASDMKEEPGLLDEHAVRVRPADPPGKGFLSFLWKQISAVDGDRCPSYPTCSTYSLMAIKKHGFLMGWLLTVDRLIHEGKEEQATSPLVLSGKTWKIYDPVENNDFWWYGREKRDHE